MDDWMVYTEATGELYEGLSNDEAADELWAKVQGLVVPDPDTSAGPEHVEAPASLDDLDPSKFLASNGCGLYATLYVRPGNRSVWLGSETDGGDTWDDWGTCTIASRADALAAIERALVLLEESDTGSGEGAEDGEEEEGDAEGDDEGTEEAVGSKPVAT